MPDSTPITAAHQRQSIMRNAANMASLNHMDQADVARMVNSAVIRWTECHQLVAYSEDIGDGRECITDRVALGLWAKSPTAVLQWRVDTATTESVEEA